MRSTFAMRDSCGNIASSRQRMPPTSSTAEQRADQMWAAGEEATHSRQLKKLMPSICRASTQCLMILKRHAEQVSGGTRGGGPWRPLAAVCGVRATLPGWEGEREGAGLAPPRHSDAPIARLCGRARHAARMGGGARGGRAGAPSPPWAIPCLEVASPYLPKRLAP